MTRRPERGSFAWRVYCDLVIGKKLFIRKAELYRLVAAKRGITRRHVMGIYDRYVRVNLRHRQVRELY